MFQSINSFADLFDVGTKVEDALREGIIKVEETSGSKNQRPTYNHGPQVSYSGNTDINALSQPEEKPRPNAYSGGQKSSTPGRHFSNLGVSLSTALERLLAKGYLRLLDPRPSSNPPPSGFRAELRCKYHQTTGHSTDHCARLRHNI